MPVPRDASHASMPAGYEFVRVLGNGGCGWVALARQSAVDRLVAVKTLHGGRADDDERRRFEREGQALARLRDHRIVAVHAMAESGEDLVLVIEFVDGPDLQRALESHTLDGAGLLRALGDVAAALEIAASAGVVHRDVKPANVLLTAESRAKLTDFGIARLAATASAFRTGTAMPIGTPRYMAPEQIVDPERESPAGDTYSFAAMVYEILLGRPPFVADDLMQLLFAHVNLEPPAPRSLRPELSPAADAVLRAGLAKDPAARPSPVHLVSVLAEHPEDWAHLAAAPSPPPPPPSAAMVTSADRTASTARLFLPENVPHLTAAAFRPPAARRSVSPVLLGAVVALVLVVVIAVIVGLLVV